MSRFAAIALPAATLARARAGDRAAHAELYTAFAPPVYGLARRLLDDAVLAEDVLQDTFIEVWRSLPAVRDAASLGFWIRRIAVNKCLMLLRAPWQQRRAALPVELPGSREALHQPLDLERLLARLSEPDRAVVWLHDVEGYTHGEIGRLFNKTASFSKSRLARAYEQLRDLLGEESEACTPTAKTC